MLPKLGLDGLSYGIYVGMGNYDLSQVYTKMGRSGIWELIYLFNHDTRRLTIDVSPLHFITGFGLFWEDNTLTVVLQSKLQLTRAYVAPSLYPTR